MASLSQALRLGDLPPPHRTFQGHATHIIEWSMMLRPNDSWSTCILQGIATFLHYASRRSAGLRYTTTLCDCTVFGTEALKAVDTMRQLGFTSTMKQTCAMEDLRQQLQGGHWPIVFVNTLPITGQRNAHAVVVVEVGSAQLTVYDPLDGERVLPQAPFLTAWAMMHNLALLIQR